MRIKASIYYAYNLEFKHHMIYLNANQSMMLSRTFVDPKKFVSTTLINLKKRHLFLFVKPLIKQCGTEADAQ